MRTFFCLLILAFATGCVDEEDIIAYQFDPERLCFIDPDFPIIVDTREVKTPHEGQITALTPVCSVNEARGLVAFQRYFVKGFVECPQGMWGDYNETLHLYYSVPTKQEMEERRCD